MTRQDWLDLAIFALVFALAMGVNWAVYTAYIAEGVVKPKNETRIVLLLDIALNIVAIAIAFTILVRFGKRMRNKEKS